jgi:hypothetical protein
MIGVIRGYIYVVLDEVIAKLPDCAIFSSADEQKSEQKITESSGHKKLGRFYTNSESLGRILLHMILSA